MSFTLRFYIEDNYISKDGLPLYVFPSSRLPYLGILESQKYPVTTFYCDDGLYISYRNIFYLYYYFFFTKFKHIVKKKDHPEFLI